MQQAESTGGGDDEWGKPLLTDSTDRNAASWQHKGVNQLRLALKGEGCRVTPALHAVSQQLGQQGSIQKSKKEKQIKQKNLCLKHAFFVVLVWLFDGFLKC